MNQDKWPHAVLALRQEISHAPEMADKIKALFRQYGSSANVEPDGWMMHLMDEEWNRLTPQDKASAEAANMGYGFYVSQGHFGWGMGCRNWLRINGFNEVAMGFENWDDHYIRCVEEALELA